MCVCAWMCVHIHTQYIPESGGILQDQELWKKKSDICLIVYPL